MGQTVKKYLLIDDNRTTIGLNTLLIRKVDESGELITAFDGREALQILVQLKESGSRFPDVILVDLKMPVMDGIEFYQEFRKIFLPPVISKTKVVLLTTSLNPLDYQYASEAGIIHFFNKPLTTAKLKEI